MADKSKTTACHTPGPWAVTTNLDYWVEPENTPDDGEFHGIAHCGDIHWPRYEEKQTEWEANARLIAAAPDLLEALQYVMTAHGEQLHDAFDMAERAIAKATGESQ